MRRLRGASGAERLVDSLRPLSPTREADSTPEPARKQCSARGGPSPALRPLRVSEHRSIMDTSGIHKIRL